MAKAHDLTTKPSLAGDQGEIRRLQDDINQLKKRNGELETLLSRKTESNGTTEVNTANKTTKHLEETSVVLKNENLELQKVRPEFTIRYS